MRYFFRRRIPDFDRVLLIESGRRSIFDTLLPALRRFCDDRARFDLVTCYTGFPEGFPADRGTVYRIADYAGSARRKMLYQELAANRYSIVVMICSDEPVMTKWKWSLALRLPAKVFVVNEGGDYFWVDYARWKTIRQFILFRAGLHGDQGVRAILRMMFFPFAFVYLLLYGAAVHLRRKVRL